MQNQFEQEIWHEMIEYNCWVNWWGTLIIHGRVYVYINAIRWQHKQDPIIGVH